MSTFPNNNRAELVEWCEAQQGGWRKNAASIGLSPQQADEFVFATETARYLLIEQERAQQAARVATQRLTDAMQQLREKAGQSVRSIRAYAATADAPEKVYNTARIAPPAQASPAPPPTTPTRLQAELNATTGALRLRWRARNPSGRAAVTYLVRRRLPGETAFTFLGAAGKKTFVDNTLPAGTPSVQYTVTPQRGENVGKVSEVLVVSLGSVEAVRDGSHAPVGSIGASAGGKLAASGIATATRTAVQA